MNSVLPIPSGAWNTVKCPCISPKATSSKAAIPVGRYIASSSCRMPKNCSGVFHTFCGVYFFAL